MEKWVKMWQAEDFFDGFATHLLFDFGFEVVDFFEAVGGAIGGTVADDDVDKATFERKNFVVAIEVAEGCDVFVKGVFVSGNVILKEGVVGAVAGKHLAFVVGEGMGETDAAELVVVAVGFEVVVAGERVVEEGAEAFADIVEIAKSGGVVGVEELGLVLSGVLAFGIGLGFAVGLIFALSELMLPDGGGDFSGAVADKNGVMVPGVAVAIFGGLSAEGVNERKSFSGGRSEFGAIDFRVFIGVFGLLDGFHRYIVAKMLDFWKFVV